MKLLICFLILFSSCSYFKKEKKSTPASTEIPFFPTYKDITCGMDKKDVENILGKNYQIYKSDTGMIEIWFYKNYYVGFDKNGKVIKFKIFKEEGGEQ
jgi:hypothetical protein